MDKILKFEASWCQPCKLLSTELNGMEFPIEALDIEQNEALTTQYGIRGVPTLVFLKDGQEVNRIVGFVSRNNVEAVIEKTYGV